MQKEQSQMGSSAEKEWQALLEAKSTLFQSLRCEHVLSVFDEVTFRAQFENLCKDHDQSDTTILFAQLQISLLRTEAFREVLSNIHIENEGRGLTGLFWGGCFATLQASYPRSHGEHNNPAGLHGVVELLCGLNDSIPESFALGADSINDQACQKFLRDIYACFMDTCLFIISYLRGIPLPEIYQVDSGVSPREYIHGSKNVITIAKALLDLTLSESTRKEDLLPEISTLPKILDYTNQHPQDARGRLVFVRNLGGGGQGNVSQVECSGKYFAQKTIKFDVPDDPMTKDEASGKREAFLREEIQIMKKLRHVHITEVIFTIKDPQSFGFAMLPVADKDLGAFLRISNEKHYLGTKISRIPQWMGCLVNALAFAHKRRIRHKDIKPVNILIKGDQIFLTDFGLAVDFSDAKLSYTTNSFKGTYPYRAPESETGMKHSRAADIFSLGCVFTEMLVAYRRRDPNRVFQSRVAYCERIPEVRKLVLSLKGNEGDSLGKFLVEATLDMLEKEPGSRKTALDLQKCFEAEEGVCCNTCRVHK